MARNVRIIIKADADDFLRNEVERAIESGEEACLEMPGYGSAVMVQIVEVLPDGP